MILRIQGPIIKGADSCTVIMSPTPQLRMAIRSLFGEDCLPVPRTPYNPYCTLWTIEGRSSGAGEECSVPAAGVAWQTYWALLRRRNDHTERHPALERRS